MFFAKNIHHAAVAHLVERHLAKVEVASSSLVGRSKKQQKEISAHMVTWPSGKAKVCKTFIHQFKSGRHLFKTCKFCDNSWKCRSFSFLKNSLCCDAMLVSARKLARSPHGAYLPQRQKSDQGRINPIFSLALLLENRYNILWIKGSKGRTLVEKRVRCAAATPPAEMPDAVPDA